MFSKFKSKAKQECNKLMVNAINVSNTVSNKKGDVNIIVIIGLLLIAAVALLVFQNFFLDLLDDAIDNISRTFSNIFGRRP